MVSTVNKAPRANINKTVIMTTAASRVIKTSITMINIMTKGAPKAGMGKTAMGLFHPRYRLEPLLI